MAEGYGRPAATHYVGHTAPPPMAYAYPPPARPSEPISYAHSHSHGPSHSQSHSHSHSHSQSHHHHHHPAAAPAPAPAHHHHHHHHVQSHHHMHMHDPRVPAHDMPYSQLPPPEYREYLPSGMPPTWSAPQQPAGSNMLPPPDGMYRPIPPHMEGMSAPLARMISVPMPPGSRPPAPPTPAVATAAAVAASVKNPPVHLPPPPNGNRPGKPRGRSGTAKAPRRKKPEEPRRAAAPVRREDMEDRVEYRFPPSVPTLSAGESKKDKKRREVLERIQRQYRESRDNREVYATELLREVGETHSTLMLTPSRDRAYQLAAAQLTIERDTLLRKTQLFYEYLSQQAQAQFEADLARWDEEARVARQRVCDKLLFSVEEKRSQLKAEKENGEVSFADSLMEQQRQSTRKLRNKNSGRPTRGSFLDDDLETPGTGGNSTSGRGEGHGAQGGNPGHHGLSSGAGALGLQLSGNLLQSMGFSLSDSFVLTTAGRLGIDFLSEDKGEKRGTKRPREEDGLIGELLSGPLHLRLDPATVLDLLGLGGSASAPFGGGGIMTGLADGGAGSEQGVVIVGPGNTKNRKKARQGPAAAALAAAATATNLGDVVESPSGHLAAGTIATASLLSATIGAGPTGRLKWDQGKSLQALTPATPEDVESDLTRIRKALGTSKKPTPAKRK